MLGKDDSYFGKGDSFFPLRIHLPDIIAIKKTSLIRRRRRCKLMNELTLCKELPLGKISARAKQAVRALKSPSARAECWPGICGPANNWTFSLGGSWDGLAGQGRWAWAQGTHIKHYFNKLWILPYIVQQTLNTLRTSVNLP